MPTITETIQKPFWHQVAHVEGDEYRKLVSDSVERELQATEEMGIDPPTIRVGVLEKVISVLMESGIGASDKRMTKLPPHAPETYWSIEQQALLRLDHAGEDATVIIRDHYEEQVTRRVTETPTDEETAEN